jgi:5,10-methylenetetrahydromethanopterin reductase
MTIAEQEAAARTGVALRDPLPWSQLVQAVETAEDTGYEAVFVPEIAGREAFSTLSALATATSSISLGAGVVSIWSRSPATTAMAAATVHDLSSGRLTLGIGAGTPRGEIAQSLNAKAGPIRLVRHYVAAVRQILTGRPASSAGRRDLFGVEGFTLGLSLQMSPPPIWLAALGDRMVRLAGEIADGVLLNWCTPERAARARALVSEAAERAGRDPRALTVAVYVRACLGLEEPVAMGALQEMTGQYASLPRYRAQMEAMGLGDTAALAAKAFQAGRPEEVPESLVKALTVMGGRGEALERFQAYREAGADLVICYPVAALDPFSSVLGTILAAAPSPAVER